MSDHGRYMDGQATPPHQEALLSTLRVPLLQIATDIDAWAEGDEVACDGVELEAKDLQRYVNERIVPHLMAHYRKRRKLETDNRRFLDDRIARERADVEKAVETWNSAETTRLLSPTDSSIALSLLTNSGENQP